jgi:two-component system sensor histidine kinase MprB
MNDEQTPPPDEDAPGTGGRPERRRSGWFQRMSLRGRLSVLTAAAVAIAIAVCACTCWFVVKDQLNAQVRQNLADTTIRVASPICADSARTAAARAEAQSATSPGLGGTQHNEPGQTQVVDQEFILPTTTGQEVCVAGDATRGIVNLPSDTSVLINGKDVYRTGSYTNGTPARIRVTTAQFEGVPVPVLIAYPLGQLQRSLQDLALVLISVAAIGALGAAGIGLLVARAALRPVDRLTDAVEHIARTEELGTTIEVNGSDEIARLSESFNSMSTALASSRDRQSQLIADAGHELRTPLTSLRTNVDLLVRSEETGRALPEETRTRMLRNMKAQMLELSTLIGDLLELSRPTRPKGSKPLEVLPLHDIVARALDRARLRGPGLTFDVDVHPWYVRADAHTMERAVINLLDNAVKFSPSGGAIDVRLRFGTLTVRDRGPGIPAEDLPHVFDRFWRSPSARQMPGSGLGLAIVAQTIRDAGGEVSLAAAEPGPDGATGGALATVRLPGAPTPPSASSAPIPPKPTAPPHAD